MKWIRHGDVVLKRVDSVKGNQKSMNECILAEGEVTGHFHKLKGQILESVFEKERFIEIKSQEAVLSHNEHDSLTIPKGKYKVLIQREVDLVGETRQVMD